MGSLSEGERKGCAKSLANSGVRLYEQGKIQDAGESLQAAVAEYQELIAAGHCASHSFCQRKCFGRQRISRLLPPATVRNAFDPCSKKKIEEIRR